MTPTKTQPGRGLSTVFTLGLLQRRSAEVRLVAHKTASEQALEKHISRVLRLGVQSSVILVALGAMVFLARHSAQLPRFQVFLSEPASLRSIVGIVGLALQGSGRGLVQLGLLVLMVTPVLRVALSLVAFAAVRDRTYVLVAAVVLAMLILGFAGGTPA